MSLPALKHLRARLHICQAHSLRPSQSSRSLTLKRTLHCLQAQSPSRPTQPLAPLSHCSGVNSDCRAWHTHIQHRGFADFRAPLKNPSLPTLHHQEAIMPPFVGAIDQGTTSSRFIIFDTQGSPVAQHQIEFKQIYPNPGSVEERPRT